MGTLYNSVMAHQEKKRKAYEKEKRKFLLERFASRGISKTKDGRELDKLSYNELKCEAVLQAFRDIDTEKDANKWF